MTNSVSVTQLAKNLVDSLVQAGIVLAGIDPNLTITGIRTMQQQVELSFDQERAVASLAALFGIVALTLAASACMTLPRIALRNASTKSGFEWP